MRLESTISTALGFVLDLLWPAKFMPRAAALVIGIRVIIGGIALPPWRCGRL